MVIAGYADFTAAGAQLPSDYSEGDFSVTTGISAVFVEQLNIFEGQLHDNADDLAYRYWDDGRKTMPRIAWEGHDEGDTSSNAATSSFSQFGEITWMSVEEVAKLLNTSTDEFTPEKFKQVYEGTWIKQHTGEEEKDENNSDAQAEEEIIEEVKNETDSANETTTSAKTNSTVEDAGTNPTTPIDDSSSGRKLASVAARFVSAALRVFGI